MQNEMRHWLKMLLTTGEQTTASLVDLLTTIRRNGKSTMGPIAEDDVVTELRLMKVEGIVDEPTPDNWRIHESKQTLFG